MSKAFTLIELMVTAAIVGTLAAISHAYYIEYVAQARNIAVTEWVKSQIAPGIQDAYLTFDNNLGEAPGAAMVILSCQYVKDNLTGGTLSQSIDYGGRTGTIPADTCQRLFANPPKKLNSLGCSIYRGIAWGDIFWCSYASAADNEISVSWAPASSSRYMQGLS